MTIVFLGTEAEQMPGLKAAFEHTHKPNGFKGCVSGIKMRTWLLELTAWASIHPRQRPFWM